MSEYDYRESMADTIATLEEQLILADKQLAAKDAQLKIAIEALNSILIMKFDGADNPRAIAWEALKAMGVGE